MRIFARQAAYPVLGVVGLIHALSMLSDSYQGRMISVNIADPVRWVVYGPHNLLHREAHGAAGFAGISRIYEVPGEAHKGTIMIPHKISQHTSNQVNQQSSPCIA